MITTGGGQHIHTPVKYNIINKVIINITINVISIGPLFISLNVPSSKSRPFIPLLNIFSFIFLRTPLDYKYLNS